MYEMWNLGMKLIWCSDIHLNFIDSANRRQFYDQLKSSEGKSIVISGDIAEATNIENYLEEMAFFTGKRIYFVAGNHDYYKSSIKEMRKQFKQIKCATYLPKRPFYKLNRHTALVGADGWGDGRNGDYEGSHLMMADWSYISELREAAYGNQEVRPFSWPKVNKEKLLRALQKIADADSDRVVKSVNKALQDKKVTRIIIVSHVPPFEEATKFAGKKSTPEGLPFFSSKMFGAQILPVVENNPNIDFLWISGHTHSRAVYKPRDNLVVKVAEAQYHRPQIEEILE